MTGDRLIRAPFFHTPVNPFRTPDALVAEEDGGLLLRAGRIADAGPFTDVRSRAPGAAVLDWRGGYLLPGLIDTHVHYPQLRIIGGLGRTLLTWLDEIALPEEVRMGDDAYAVQTARLFVQALASHGTTTALVFGSHFTRATAALFEAADMAGLRVVSGLVVADRALRAELHRTPEVAYQDSAELIARFHGRGRLLYAVTPRFALSASDALLEVCQTLVREHAGVRVQTHINEQPDEVDACVRAFPGATDYLSIYERYGLTGPGVVLAHSVQSTDGELRRMAASGTSVSHCPSSNAALGSGIFPMARHLAAGVHCALGTDVGGGTGFGMLKEALQAYLMQRVAPTPLTLDPAALLYLATRAGADALQLGNETGDFSIGKSADLVYVRPDSDTPLAAALERTDSMRQALAAIITLGGADAIADVWVGGESVVARDRG